MEKLNLLISCPSLFPPLDSSSLACKLAYNKRLALENSDLEVALSSSTGKFKHMEWLLSDIRDNSCVIVHYKAVPPNIVTFMQILITTCPALFYVVAYLC